MHKEMINFVNLVKRKFPDQFEYCDVLDVGSLDINGNNRQFFQHCNYIGIDLCKGKNVDFATPVHQFKTNMLFDTVICTEVLEHDQHYKKSIEKMIELLKPGGLLIITAATTGRPVHGFIDETPEDSPATNFYYKNISAYMLKKAVYEKPFIFCDSLIMTNEKSCDIYFYGLKASDL